MTVDEVTRAASLSSKEGAGGDVGRDAMGSEYSARLSMLVMCEG